MYFYNASQVSGFVNILVVFSENKVYLKKTCSSLVFSFTKWYLILIFLVQWWFLLFRLFIIELLLSVWMVISSGENSLISSKYLVNQKAWVIAYLYSASTMNNTTVSYLLLFQDTSSLAIKNMLSLVDYLVFLQLAKSKLTKSTEIRLFILWYIIL